MRLLQALSVFALTALVAPHWAFAQAVTYDVNINTSSLVNSVAGPFSLAFQLAPGSGDADDNSRVELTNFDFGGGAVLSPPSLVFGGVAGNIGSSVTMRDNDFLNFFAQAFAPGSSLRFTANLFLNPDVGGINDIFAVYILDGTGQALPTLAGPFIDSFFEASPDESGKSSFTTYASDPDRPPAGGGPPVTVTATATEPTTATPEPDTGVLALTGMLGIALAARLRTRGG